MSVYTRCIHMRQGSPSSHSTSALSRTHASDASSGQTKIASSSCRVPYRRPPLLPPYKTLLAKAINSLYPQAAGRLSAGMRNASVIFACPKKRRRGQNWQKRLDRMAVGCSSRSALKAVCPGYGNWRQSKRCGGCGCSTIMPANKAPRGVRMESCPPQQC